MTPDLLVIGGGVIGLSAARAAARRGLSVVVVERGEPGMGASWAAAGMLSPMGEAREPGPFLEFGLKSLRMYRSWLETLVAESGVPVEYVEGGKIQLAWNESEAGPLQDKVAWAADLGVGMEWRTRTHLDEHASGLSDGIVGGLVIDEDFRIDSRSLGRALTVSAGRQGIRVLSGAEVRGVEIDGGRVSGVTLADGSSMGAGAVLVAAGAWSGTLVGLPHRLPVGPVRGQMLALAPDRLPSTHVLESEEAYLVPRNDGRLLVGATVEEVGFQARNTAEGTLKLTAAAVEMIPDLASAPIVEIWSGFRPGTADRNPILGPDPEIEGLFYATGHFRNGILLAPATAEAIGDLVLGDGGSPIPLAFLADRFLAPSRPDGTFSPK